MFFVTGAVISSTLILVMFRLFPRLKVNNLVAILANYVIASGFSIFLAPGGVAEVVDYPHQSWFFIAVINGVLFIALFNLFAQSSQKVGLAITSVANKMSVVIPVLVAILFYNELLLWQKGIGLVLALVAFYLTLMKNEKPRFDRKYLYLPVILFFGGGICDSILNYATEYHITGSALFSYLSVVFATSFIVGLFILAMGWMEGSSKYLGRSMIAGVLLGVMNFASTWFFLGALDNGWLESSVFIPVFNASIVATGGINGVLFFRERMSTINLIGFVLAIISIFIIAS
ncbi:MAG: hypothetical protein KKA07_16835 [Bacteroidetes bacterium]|nr:hypothetical protein [Bacteroidota bacterium]MBU1720734.1 hypothetical protein [Bacteroidota bacterium]